MQIETVSKKQLEALGFLPDDIIGSPRLKGHPVKVRYRDDMVERDAYGAISVSMGYFSEVQVAWRRWMAGQMNTAFQKALQK